MVQLLANLAALILTWIVWLWLGSRKFAPAVDLGIAVGSTLVVIPAVLIGRRLLDRQENVSRARLVVSGVHYTLAILLGSAILCATRFGLNSTTWLIPLPPWLGLVLMLLGGLFLLLVVTNLLVKGMGAPFAFGLTRLVATEWIYAWTRNPMILSALAFLIGLGLWLGSILFLVWLLAVLSPAVLFYLTFFEERELEIRFGEQYLAYKDQTPRFFPRRPRRASRG